MENIKRTATEQTLEVNFDYKNERIFIKGESYPENSVDFFKPLFKWIDDYFEKKTTMEAVFEIDYLNSSSYKSIFDVIATLSRYVKKGKEIDIKWYYPEDDEDILEQGEDFAEDNNLEITLIPIE